MSTRFSPRPATWRARGLAFALAGGSIAGVTYLLACNGGSGGGAQGDAAGPLSVPAVFVIDSTGKLFSFDIAGIALQNVALPGPVGPLQGAGIAYQAALPATTHGTNPVGALPGGGTGTSGTATAGGFPSPTLFVTLEAPNNRVAAYTLDLAPQTWLTPQLFDSGLYFPDLQAPRGIVYAADYSMFYVASAGSSDGGVSANGGCTDPQGHIEGVCGFNSSGSPFELDEDCSEQTGGVCATSGPAGVAWDPDDHTIWVANYLGAPQSSGAQLGVSEYTYLGGNAQTFDYTQQFVTPGPHEEPYSIAVCPKSATGGHTVVLVGFIDDGSGQGTGAVQAYSTSGAAIGGPLEGPIVGPYAMSCDPTGKLYVADKSGLYSVQVEASYVAPAAPPPGFPGLTSPIYGVYARTDLGTAADGGTGSDATADTSVAETGPSDAPHYIDVDLPDAPPFDAAPIQADCPSPPSNPGWNGSPITLPEAGSSCVLTGPITADKVLSPSDCIVYDVPGGLQVSGGTLTIEAGATLAFGDGTGLQVAANSSAGLVVAGATCNPVVFTSDSEFPRAGSWGTVQLDGQLTADSSISGLVIQYAGGPENGDNFSPASQAALAIGVSLQLSDVTAWENGGSGIVFLGKDTGPLPVPSSGIGALSVTDWPPTSSASPPPNPFQIDADAAWMLQNVHVQSQPVYPGTTVSVGDGGAPRGWVYLYATCTNNASPIDIVTTWPSIAMPYVLGEPGYEGPGGCGYLDIDSNGTPSAQLTIESPNTIQLGAGFYFRIGTSGQLIANGDITFEPIPPGDAPDAATPGEWSGFLFVGGAGTAGSSQLVGVTIDGAGAGEPGGWPNCEGIPASIVLEGGGCQVPPTLENITFLNQPANSYAIDGENIGPNDAYVLQACNGNFFGTIQPFETCSNNTCPYADVDGGLTCEGPPPSCPASAPSPGTSCEGAPVPCTYAATTCVCIPTSSGQQWSCT